ncbi:hypothetical protein CI15_20025 [Paraburkholderia monticola]|uniref:Uncharacterized protein n=1 Tax=Paraburkholderia monticola TaxID=1399968 RepID=A0A149PK72_9BURK|nr:hypothetical protein CI15_20025 [Paraburkholderia monticola]
MRLLRSHAWLVLMDLVGEASMLPLAFYRVDRDKQIRYPRKEIATPGCRHSAARGQPTNAKRSDTRF